MCRLALGGIFPFCMGGLQLLGVHAVVPDAPATVRGSQHHETCLLRLGLRRIIPELEYCWIGAKTLF